jgi:hypothetical protein
VTVSLHIGFAVAVFGVQDGGDGGVWWGGVVNLAVTVRDAEVCLGLQWVPAEVGRNVKTFASCG